jgi:tricorn protease
MIRPYLSLWLLLTAATTSYSQVQEPLLPQQPTLSQAHVVFCYAGDLWIIDREGGAAKRLTSGPANDWGPVFSPDGSQVAFSREAGIDFGVYIVPAAGGEPRRLAYGQAVVGWTRDGKQVVFASPLSSRGICRLFTVSFESGPATELCPPSAFYGSFSPDGKSIAYLPFGTAHYEWKGYRGGATAQIWIAYFPDCHIEKIPRGNSNDFNPMWVDDRIYFLSDRDGLISLFAYDTGTKKVSKTIKNPESDILSASAGPGAIVYERFGSLHLYDFKTGKSSRLEIRTSREMPDTKPHAVKVTDNLTGMRLSPTGDRVLIEARGDLLVLPTGNGEARNVTSSPGVFERFPAWSPDGRRIAYFSDESGEYALHIRSLDGTGAVKKIDLGSPPGFYFSPSWSPDSKKIAYRDHRLTFWYVDIESGTLVRIDSGYYGEHLWARMDAPPASWSPDSRWLSYTRMIKNHLRALCIYSLEAGRSYQITDGMSDVRSPQFDRNGKYLYFAASTDIGPSLGDDLSAFNHPPTLSIYTVFLRKGDSFPKAADEKASSPVTIDLVGLDDRIFALPVPARNYARITTSRPGILFLSETIAQPQSGILGAWPYSNSENLHQFDMVTRKTEKILEEISNFDLSCDGEKMLYKQGQKWAVSPAGAGAKPDEGALKLDSLQVRVDPVAEWRQMFREVWRAVRDLFYDPGFHGLDLESSEKRFEPYLDGVASSADLNYLFREMLSQVRVSHIGAYAGTGPAAETASNGFLGADYEIVDGRYRFSRIYAGDKWDPKMRAPLVQPGMDIRQGDFLLAVDGEELRASDNIERFFAGKAGRDVVLRIAADAAGSRSRDVTVVPIDGEWSLRYFAWVDENRRKVDKSGGGRVAYIHLPDTREEGLAAFDRYFFAQADKEAVIIDARDNGGGALADYFINRLAQGVMAVRTGRVGQDVTVPYSIVRGPKVMITNESTFSGGDHLANLFRQARLGSLIGTRTYGAAVGGIGPTLIDGGSANVPYFAFYTPEGTWIAENEGIAPDIEVEQDPAAVRAGHDPQLEKAIDVVMELLEKNPPPVIKRPPYKRLH